MYGLQKKQQLVYTKRKAAVSLKLMLPYTHSSDINSPTTGNRTIPYKAVFLNVTDNSQLLLLLLFCSFPEQGNNKINQKTQ